MDTIKLVALVKRAKMQRKVLESLEQPAIPSEIVLTLFTKPSASAFATVSRALSDLQEKDLIELLNPEERTGRTYRLTTQGKAVLSYLQKEKTRREKVSHRV